eukprot:gene39179-51584_t
MCIRSFFIISFVTLALNAEITEGFHRVPLGSRFSVKSGESDISKVLLQRRYSSNVVSMVASTEDIENTLVAVDSRDGIPTRLSSDMPPYALNTQQFVYVVLTSIFITCLIVADVIGVKLFEFNLPFPILGHKTIEHTCGMITFPITFLLGDTINEYYGAKATRQTVYIGLAMSILVFGVINLAQVLPYLDRPFNVSKEAFDTIFGSAKLMYVASITAYLLGQLSDIWLFGVIKRLTKAFSLGKSLTGQIPATLNEVFDIAVT